MFKKYIKKVYYNAGAAFTVGYLSVGTANAAANDFSLATQNIVTSIQDVSGGISALSYFGGVCLGCLGVLKVKDHVENPSNTPLKEGAVRLGAGGTLLAMPFVFEMINNTIQGNAAATGDVQDGIYRVDFDVVQ